MFYKKYLIYDNKIEIMIPSEFEYNQEEYRLSANSWISKDKTIKIDVNLSVYKSKAKNDLNHGLQDYFLGYKKYAEGFKCELVKKITIYDIEYGELDFSLKIKGFGYFNSVLFTYLGDRELTINLQCPAENKEEYMNIFEIIKDSVKIHEGGVANEN